MCVGNFLFFPSLGLYDKPVVIEGKRARKSTEFLVNQTPPAFNKEAKPLFFEVKQISNSFEIYLFEWHTIQSNLFNMDTYGTGKSVRIIEVSILQRYSLYEFCLLGT